MGNTKSEDRIIDGKLCDKDGNKYEFVQLDDKGKPDYGAHTHDEFMRLTDERIGFVRRTWYVLCRIMHKADRIVDSLRLAKQRLFQGFETRESWSIDYSLMEFLITRVEMMMKNRCGVPTSYCLAARKELKRLGKTDKISKKEYDFSKHEMNLADKMFDKDLKKLVLNARLYIYYMDLGVGDKRYGTESFEKKYPLPKNRKNGQLDYKAIDKLRVKAKNEVLNYLKDKLEELWD